MKICGIVIKIGLNVLQIRTHRCARLEPNSNYFSRDVPERDNNRNIFLWSNFKIYISQEPMRILKSTTDLLAYYGLLSAE